MLQIFKAVLRILLAVLRGPIKLCYGSFKLCCRQQNPYKPNLAIYFVLLLPQQGVLYLSYIEIRRGHLYILASKGPKKVRPRLRNTGFHPGSGDSA